MKRKTGLQFDLNYVAYIDRVTRIKSNEQRISLEFITKSSIIFITAIIITYIIF